MTRDELLSTIRANQKVIRHCLKELARIDGVDCPNYFVRDYDEPQPCVLECGHQGLHKTKSKSAFGDLTDKKVIISGIPEIREELE